VVEDICWSVWHRNMISANAFSVGDWRRSSTHGMKINRLKEKNLGGHWHGDWHPRRECSTSSSSKRDHLEGWVGQAGTASNIREEERASSGVRVCILCADSTQTSHLPKEALCTGEATIMLGGDTKKDAHKVVEIHYNMPHHELTPRGGGLARVAGQRCLAGPSVLRLHPHFGDRPG